jgi:glycosyltransferase involved in cell wall biosynthesis
LAVPVVTLVIPAYRESSRLPPLLSALADIALAEPAPATEILVVDDGSEAEEVERERAAVIAAGEKLERAGAPHRVRFVAAPRNEGKGAAIRRGWAEADPGATWLGFLDADGAVRAREAWRLVRMTASAEDLDVLSGTRVLMAGRQIERSLYRHLQGRVFATLVERSFQLGFYDTQCGVKLVRSDLLRPLLPVLRETRWLLDVELLALLGQAGARMREVPIDWSDPGGSKVRPGLDALKMALGLWRIRRRLDGARNGAPRG